MLQKIVFLLREYKDIDWQKCLEELISDLQKHKIAYEFGKSLDGNASDNKECCFGHYSIEGAGTQCAEGILYVSDLDAVCRELSGRGYYVLPYRHDHNREEAFESDRYFYIAEKLEETDYASLDMVYRRLAGIPWDILTTNCCTVRETMVEDVDSFYDIYREPSITEYMEDLYADRNEEIAYVQDYIKKVYHFYGYGMWTVVEKESGQVIGRAGISWREGFDLPELGFVIGVPWQRKGYAYEVCSAILAYAREELGMTRVQALVMRGNEKSGRLCEKLGFACMREARLEGIVYNQYEKQLSDDSSNLV